jgi:hypothetical protein
MSDIDRNDPLWKALSSVCSVDDAYRIATRHRDEAVDHALALVAQQKAEHAELCKDIYERTCEANRYRADAERLQAKLAETPWEVWEGKKLWARYQNVTDAKKYWHWLESYTIRNAITGEEVK